MRKIILASSSPRRKELLKNLGLTFSVVPSEIEEKLNPRLSPLSQAESLAKQKGEAVYKRYEGEDAVIIAADTIVVLEKRIFGKPASVNDAKRMLGLLSGKEHCVVTGFAVIDCLSGKTISQAIETKVFMQKLTKNEIASYVAKEHVMDKSGSYAMQGRGALLFERIEGDYFSVAGLPLFALAKVLHKFGVILL